MSKWKCEICNSEFENYYAQGFEGIIHCPLCYYKELYKRDKQEIERLKKREQECIDHYLVQCRYASEMEGKYITANYVINELEKYLNEQIEKSWEIEEQCYENIESKLQELKGSDKE